MEGVRELDGSESLSHQDGYLALNQLAPLIVWRRFARDDRRQSWRVRRFFFSIRRRHTRFGRDWSSDVCSSDLMLTSFPFFQIHGLRQYKILDTRKRRADTWT